MSKFKIYGVLIWFLGMTGMAYSQTDNDSLALTLKMKGQASGFVLFNPENTLELYTGGRYIPQLNLEKKLPKKHILDLEVSANIFGTMGFSPFDTASTNGEIRPYRGWVRYSTPQLEIRAGLQKINFGSASILRPLMWFDQIDPRDPLQLTDGVYGVLGRYYFLNNANVWLWGLYGNKNRRGFDTAPSDKKVPEFGGRIQLPTKDKGEIAFTYHHRKADVSSFGIMGLENTPEHRFGIDGKWDLKVGLWMEATWIHKTRDIAIPTDLGPIHITNQHLINIGTDYTFGIGSGLNVIAEQLIIATSEDPFTFDNTSTLTAVSANYPLGLFDNVSAIIYYDWAGENFYNLLQWQHSFSALTLNVLAFWNPKNSQLPQQQFSENLFGGKGIQVLLVYNH